MPKKKTKSKSQKKDLIKNVECRYFNHLIECTCVLPTLKQKDIDNIVYHKFIVFSTVDENNKFNTSYESCNNCGVIHKITSTGMSEISVGEDEAKNILTISDIKFMIPTRLSSLLEKYDCEKWKWQEVLFMFQNSIWEKPIILDKDFDDKREVKNGKILIMKSKDDFLIKTFESNEVFFI